MKLLDTIYKELDSKKSKKGLSFDKISSTILGKEKEDYNKVNNLYTALQLDHRFIKKEDNNWTLRKFYSLKEIESILANNMVNNVEDENSDSLDEEYSLSKELNEEAEIEEQVEDN